MTMSSLNNPDHLRTSQYRTPGNLQARMSLHERYSTNTYGWQRWVFDHLLAVVPPDGQVLEVGAGPAELWRHNLDHVPRGWQITLSDFSPGMVEVERQVAESLGGQATCVVADAQGLPFPDDAFDAVVANHMLYHVPDRPRAFAELRRVLKPGGALLAATNGDRHLRELHDLVAPYLPAMPTDHFDDFTMANGATQLAPFFGSVARDGYVDSLVVTEAEPLLAYVDSMLTRALLPDDARAELERHIRREIATNGAFRIGKESGLFLAVR